MHKRVHDGNGTSRAHACQVSFTFAFDESLDTNTPLSPNPPMLRALTSDESEERICIRVLSPALLVRVLVPLNILGLLGGAYPTTNDGSHEIFLLCLYHCPVLPFSFGRLGV